MQSIRFEGRELKSYAEPVTVSDLQKGSVYFAVQFADRDMLIPTVETLIFVGRSNDPNGGLLFQTVDSYNAGVRFESATEDELLSFCSQPEGQLNHIFDYDHALNELMKCALRRNRFQSR